MTFLVLIALSVGITLLLKQRKGIRRLENAYNFGLCRSFLIDIPLLLPLVGLVVELLASHTNQKWGAKWWTKRVTIYSLAIGIFWAISGALYLDYLNLSMFAPILGYPEAWSGNHFMWNSGIELLGFSPLVTAEATYKDFWGFWNLSAMAIFIAYPFVMVKIGTWLKGLLFGYTEKQTGVSALFFERKLR